MRLIGCISASECPFLSCFLVFLFFLECICMFSWNRNESEKRRNGEKDGEDGERLRVGKETGNMWHRQLLFFFLVFCDD